jgi:hypothetical protein
MPCAPRGALAPSSRSPATTEKGTDHTAPNNQKSFNSCVTLFSRTRIPTLHGSKSPRPRPGSHRVRNDRLCLPVHDLHGMR